LSFLDIGNCTGFRGFGQVLSAWNAVSSPKWHSRYNRKNSRPVTRSERIVAIKKIDGDPPPLVG
jgi:hypothetical protein